jgi:hypothetical protein
MFKHSPSKNKNVLWSIIFKDTTWPDSDPLSAPCDRLHREIRCIGTTKSVPAVRLFASRTPPTVVASDFGGFAGLAAARYRHQRRRVSANNRDANAESQRWTVSNACATVWQPLESVTVPSSCSKAKRIIPRENKGSKINMSVSGEVLLVGNLQFIHAEWEALANEPGVTGLQVSGASHPNISQRALTDVNSNMVRVRGRISLHSWTVAHTTRS